MHSNILKVESVLAAFGNATTPSNQDATCFTKYYELQFEKGKMVGMKLIEYLLEKSRISGALDGGFTFHVFYHLLDGATHQERISMHLSDAAHFQYLNSVKMRGVGFAQSKTGQLDLIRVHLKSLGIGRRQQTELWQLMAAVLHIGNINFQTTVKQEACSVKNYSQLQLVADMLGVTPASLLTVLTCRLRYVGKDAVSSYLDVEGAIKQRDSFARSLYAVIFSWIMEQLNIKLCAPEAEWSNLVSLLEVPGLAGMEIQENSFHRLLVNYANERIHSFAMKDLCQNAKARLSCDELIFPPENRFNQDVLETLSQVKVGILPLIDLASARSGAGTSTTDSLTAKIYENHTEPGLVFVSASSKKLNYAFGVHHFGGIVDYDTRNFIDSNRDTLQSSFVTLIRGNPEEPGTSNPFLRSLFSDKLIATQKSERDGKTVMSANSRNRHPSMRRATTKSDSEDEDIILEATTTVGHLYRTDISGLLDTISATNSWFIFHLKSCHMPPSGKPDIKIIQRQLDSFEIATLNNSPGIIYVSQLTHEDFVARYSSVASLWDRNAKIACETLIRNKNWTSNEAVVGSSHIYLSELAFRLFELKLKANEEEEQRTLFTKKDLLLDSGSLRSATDKAHGIIGDAFGRDEASEYGGTDDSASQFDYEFGYNVKASSIHDARQDIELGDLKSKPLATGKNDFSPPEPTIEMSRLRCQWLTFVYSTTFCCFPFCLSFCGRMRPKERQLAWREKVALCIIIFMMNVLILFFIIGIGYIVCPKTNALSVADINSLNTDGPKAAVYMYGDYYFIHDIISSHNANLMDNARNVPAYWAASVLGRDVSPMFNRGPVYDDATWNSYCKIPRTTIPKFNLYGDTDPKTGWYVHQNTIADFNSLKQYKGPGGVIFDVPSLQANIDNPVISKRYLTAYDKIYDVSAFYDTGLQNVGNQALGAFFQNISDAHSKQAGYDSTWLFESLKKQDRTQFTNVMGCMNNLFLIGSVDHRQDAQCVITNYVLLAAAFVLIAVIGFKFFAALQFTGLKSPEEHEKFVICQVPCYTEGEDSIKRTIESLANMGYDDKHKLLFIICDGMIIGAGNDRPTPRIVLDLLGVDPSTEPESFAFQSLGEGNYQLNLAKVYSGLYEINGHVVPFIVVVKVGKPSEQGKPGNRY